MDTKKLISYIEENLNGKKVSSIYDGKNYYTIKMTDELDPWYKMDKRDNEILPLNMKTDFMALLSVTKNKPIIGKPITKIGVKS